LLPFLVAARLTGGLLRDGHDTLALPRALVSDAKRIKADQLKQNDRRR
jgi:hypothetical protein